MSLALDTNAYSDLMRGDQKVADVLNGSDEVCLPVIVVGELKRGFYNGSRSKENIGRLNEFISESRTQVLNVTAETAEQYGHLAAYLKRNGTPIPTNDIWIAALAVQYDLPLLTRDSDFDRLPQVKRIG